MLKVDIKKWIQSSTFVRERIWFGYLWAKNAEKQVLKKKC